MSRLYDIVNNIADRILNNTTQPLSSSNWTASKASFTSGFVKRYGNVVVIMLALKATASMTAGTEYTLGTLNGLTGITLTDTSVGLWGFGNCNLLTSGQLYLVPNKAVATGTNIYPKIMIISD